MRCRHPDADPENVRRFQAIGGSFFAVQCPACHSRVGKKLDPTRLAIHPRKIRWAERKPAGATGLGGRGNARKRKLSDYYKSAAWKKKRARRLEMDCWTCQACGEPGDQVHHLRYPDELGTESVEHDLATSCGECNLEEKSQRIANTGGKPQWSKRP